MSSYECIKEHLNHIRHIELEASALLGFYGVFLVWVIPSSEFYGLAFVISFIFLLIIFKLNSERSKHWKIVEKFANEINDNKLKECMLGLFPLKGFFPRLISVFRLIITLLLGLTTYFLIYIIHPYIIIYCRELLAAIIAIIYLLLDARRESVELK